MVEEPLGHDFNHFNSQKPHQLPTRLLHGVPGEVLHDLHNNSHQEGGFVVRSCVKGTQEKYRKYRAKPKRTASQNVKKPA